MDPIDEVRAVMAVFDETLFRVVPTVYRELDRALAATESGRVAPPVHAFLRFGSWVGADRDGNPFVTAQVTREAATIQADHMLRALENATTRIGRALTLHEATTPPTAGLRRALAAAVGRAPGTAGRDRGPVPAGAVPDLPAVRGAADQRDPGPARRPGLPGTGRVSRRPAHRPGVAGRGRGGQAGVR